MMNEEERPIFDPSIVRAITFDGFGTLFDFPTPRFKATFAEIAAQLSPPVDGDRFWKQWLEVGRREWGQSSPEEGPQTRRTGPFRTYRELWRTQFQDTFAELGVGGDAFAVTDFLFREIVGTSRYPEAPDVIAALRNHFPIALVSNADDEFLTAPLKGSGLTFDAVISSETAQSYKPEAAIFQKAAEALNVDMRAILHVGDSPMADVTGASRAGLQSVWVDRDGAEYPERASPPHLRIVSLDELLPALGLATFD